MSAALRARQRALAALITGEDEPGDVAVQASLRAAPGQPVRVDIYRAAYRARLVAALRANVPVLHQVLGDEAFEALALGYLQAHPSTEPSIRWFGHRLADWLDARLELDPDALPHPALADLARMEWAIGTAFDAADATPVTVADLAALTPQDWAGLRLAGHPALQRVGLGWAVEPLWRALTRDPEANTAPPEALDHRLLVWREGLSPRWRAAEADEDGALAALLSGASFGELCLQVAAQAGAEAAPARVAGWLRGWVEAGMLVAR